MVCGGKSCVEEKMIEQQTTEDKGRRKKRGGIWKFILILAFSCLCATGLLGLWAWVCYQMHYSVSVIRAGLMMIYILPCLFGGRLLRVWKRSRLPLWGALLGSCFFGLLCLCSFLEQGEAEWKTVDVAALFMCLLSGIAGTIRIRKSKRKQNRLQT